MEMVELDAAGRDTGMVDGMGVRQRGYTGVGEDRLVGVVNVTRKITLGIE